MNKRDFLRTSAAFLLPAAAGAFSSLALVMCGILTAIVTPLLFALYHLLH